MAGGMLAQDDLGSWSGLQAQALSADGHTAVGADFNGRANAPDKRPPGTARHRAQEGALFLLGELPGLERSHLEFAMEFMLVVMLTELIEVEVGLLELGDLLTGEVSRPALLPKLVAALDFALGAGAGRVTEVDPVKAQSPSQLREGLRHRREEHRVVIDVEFQRQAVLEERCREKVQVGQQGLTLVNLGAGEDPAAIIQHIE